MSDIFEQQARTVAHSMPPCDFGSTAAIKAVAVALREAYRMGREGTARRFSADEIGGIRDTNSAGQRTSSILTVLNLGSGDPRRWAKVIADYVNEAIGSKDTVVTHAMVRAACESRARDDEGQFESLGDLLGFSGQNKAHTVVRAALEAALSAPTSAAGGV